MTKLFFPNGEELKISHSKLATAVGCNMAFYLKYIKGIPSPDTEETLFGSAIHAQIETNTTGEPLKLKPNAVDSLKENSGIINEFINAAVKKGLIPFPNESGNIDVISERSNKISFNGDMHPNLETLNIEYDISNLNYTIDVYNYNIPVIGAIDILMRHSSSNHYEWSILDHKSKKKYDPRFAYTEDTIVQDDQLLFYAGVLGKSLGKNPNESIRIGHNYFYRLDQRVDNVYAVISYSRAYEYLENRAFRIVKMTH